MLLSTSEVNVADLGPGQTATVSGTAVSADGEWVDAELLDAEGLVVGTTVAQYERDASETGSTGNWDTFHDSIDSAPLAVEDATGRVAVDVPTADAFSGDVDFNGTINLDRDVVTTGSGDDQPVGTQAYAEAHDVSDTVLDPAAFTLSTEGKPSAFTQVFLAVFIGVFGVGGTVAGTVFLLLPYLQAIRTRRPGRTTDLSARGKT